MLGQGSFTRAYEGTGSVYPKFFIQPIENHLASAKAGRPIFDEVEMVEILMPGIAAYTVPVEKVNEEHKQRWPQQYEAFKAGREYATEGTPLEEWPRLRTANVYELKALGFRTVEDVAKMSDTAMQTIGRGGPQLREAAVAFLDVAAETALTGNLQATVDRLEAENAALKHEVAELGQLTRQMHANMMARANAPDPIATAIPAMSDPLQAAAFEAAGQHSSAPEPQSSLASFVNERRRPGRPRREPQEAIV